MVETHAHFDKRLKVLGRKHEKMTRGFVTKLGKDGLIRVEPRPAYRAKGPSLMFLAFVLIVGFFFVKALMVTASGAAAYNDRLAILQNGTAVEKAGASLLVIDPLTKGLADIIGPVVR